MKKNRNLLIITLSLAGLLLFAWSCVKDAEPVQTRPGPAIPVQPSTFVEEFDSVALIESRGWHLLNITEPRGGSGWKQGKYELGGKFGGDVVGFPAYSANNSPTDYICADVTSVNEVGTINCWLVTPSVPIKNGDHLIFYSRAGGNYADRLQVRGNFIDTTLNIGGSATNVGQYNRLLLDINPSLLTSGYPVEWTKFTITVSGLANPVSRGRFAFRYFVPNGGNSGANGEQVGIDSVAFVRN